MLFYFFFFFQAEDGIRDGTVTGVQTCALPILGLHAPEEEGCSAHRARARLPGRHRERARCAAPRSRLSCAREWEDLFRLGQRRTHGEEHREEPTRRGGRGP